MTHAATIQCSRMRATCLLMNYPRDPKSQVFSLKATFLIINHPILSKKSIKSKLKSQMEDCEGLPTLSPPVKEFKLAKIQVNYNQLPRSRWSPTANQVEGGKDKVVEPISTASTLLVIQGSGLVSSSSSSSRWILHKEISISIITKSTLTIRPLKMSRILQGKFFSGSSFLPSLREPPQHLGLVCYTHLQGHHCRSNFGMMEKNNFVEVLYFIPFLTI